ncbi:MAG TPA: MOSC domain-containing protein, partial [Acidobacteriota bacterium]|nr:MOSC domain-containing protein [Acidobacteriota bacterium]
MTANVEAIFIAPEAGEPMRRVGRVRAKKGFGLEGDRYCLDGKEKEGEHCQVTLVGAGGLREAEESFDVNLSNGEHRRNLVISG